MGQQQSYTERLHESLCNKNKARLDDLMDMPEFVSANITADILLELLERNYDNATVKRFADIADDDQLALLVSFCILYVNACDFSYLFEHMRNRRDTIGRHHLQSLFMTVCDRADVDAMEVMIKYGCYDATDERVLRAIFRTEMVKSSVNERALRLVMQSHPGHRQSAQFLLDSCPVIVKNTAIRDTLTAMLKEYVIACDEPMSSNNTATNLTAVE